MTADGGILSAVADAKANGIEFDGPYYVWNDVIYAVMLGNRARAGTIIRFDDRGYWEWINWNYGPDGYAHEITVTGCRSLREAFRQASADITERRGER